jgi:ABC-type transporter MlaC component
MLRFVVVLTSLLGPQLLWAQAAKPVSVSYENLTRCFPELKDQSLSFKVDLNRLKDLIDEKFVTSQSQLRQRKIQYVDADQQRMNLILRLDARMSKKSSTHLILQKVDDKGLVTDLKLTKNQATNPKQEVINNFLLGANIKSDEYSYIDTKLNGVVSTYRRNFKDVMEIELSDKPRQRSVMCEKRDELGIICTCTKK